MAFFCFRFLRFARGAAYVSEGGTQPKRPSPIQNPNHGQALLVKKPDHSGVEDRTWPRRLFTVAKAAAADDGKYTRRLVARELLAPRSYAALVHRGLAAAPTFFLFLF